MINKGTVDDKHSGGLSLVKNLVTSRLVKHLVTSRHIVSFFKGQFGNKL